MVLPRAPMPTLLLQHSQKLTSWNGGERKWACVSKIMKKIPGDCFPRLAEDEPMPMKLEGSSPLSSMINREESICQLGHMKEYRPTTKHGDDGVHYTIKVYIRWEVSSIGGHIKPLAHLFCFFS